MEYTPSDLDDNPFRYCGEYYDKETGTIYLRARYYDAEQGRFTQEDPIRDGYNWYSYCDGNPVMFVDPTGQTNCVCFGDDFDLLSFFDPRTMGIGGGSGGNLSFYTVNSKCNSAGNIVSLIISLGTELINYINAVGADTTVRFFADGKQSVQNTIEKFAQDFNNNTTNPPDPNNLPDPNNWNHHDYYMNQAENEKLKRIIEQLYREDAEIGDGGTADMLRYEYKNGLELEHLQKATDRINELHKLVNSNVLSESDLKLAYQLLDDLHNAVKMVKGG